MSFHKRKSDGLWFVKYYEGGKERRKYTTTGRKGEIEAQELDAKIKREGPPKATLNKSDLPTFFYVTKQYLERHVKNDRTAYDIRSRLKKWVTDLFGHKPVNDLSMKDLLALDKSMRDTGLSEASINRVKAYCRAIMSWAVEYDLAESNPFLKFKSKKEAPAPDPPTPEEMERIRQAAPPHLLWALTCEENLGFRPGKTELFAVRMDDIDFDRGGVWILRTKTDDKKTLQPCLNEFMTALAGLKASEPNRTFLIEYKGKAVGSLKTAWWATLRRAGIYEERTVITNNGWKRKTHKPVKEQKRRIRLYDFRHWYATTMLRSGADLKAVSELMGHSTPQVTLSVYYHVIEGQKRSALEHLSPTTKGDANDRRKEKNNKK